MHDSSARIKRNFLGIPVCLRSIFIIRFQAHLYAALAIPSVLLFARILFSVLPPCVWQCLSTECTNFCAFYQAMTSKTTSGK